MSSRKTPRTRHYEPIRGQPAATHTAPWPLHPSAMRPWAPGSGVRSGHGRTRTSRRTGRKRPRTGPVGAVMLTTAARITALTWYFRMPARCRHRPRHRRDRLERHPVPGVGAPAGRPAVVAHRRQNASGRGASPGTDSKPQSSAASSRAAVFSLFTDFVVCISPNQQFSRHRSITSRNFVEYLE